uniref:Calmodulin-binding domain-containing protein n=1 Tax=Panagrolaimus sp. PS1159 TaxID=55785 RepID=A0AC35GHM3_9BILA
MRRSSEEPVPPKQNINDFDFGWGPRPEGSISPLPSGGRHHTISSGVAGKPFRAVQIEPFPPIPRPPKQLPPITPETPPAPALSYHSRRPTSNGSFIIRKQDSIAEEPSPNLFENDGEHFTWSRSPSPIKPQGFGFDSPDARRKLSLSPAATTNSLYTNVFARRKQFQREVSTAHSDVTETITRKQMTDASTSPIPPAYSCENNLQIRFDISSGSSLNKSTSSSFGRSHSQKRIKKSSLAHSHGGSLVANGFLPATNFLAVESKPSPRIDRDPTKWHLSITKQRSSSESAFQASSIPRTMLESGLQIRRCSVANLNPAKENALLRKILGPSGLSWLHDNNSTSKHHKSGDQLSKKSLSLVLSDDPEGQRFQEDSRTPLMKDEKGGGRLIARQRLYLSRRVTSDYALLCAVLGIIVMIIENELSASGIHSKSSITSLTLKGIILISTAVLLGLVIKFHVHEVQLFMNANSAEDWRIALTCHRCFNILLELTICGICPLPFNLYFPWTTVHSDGITVSTTEVPVDVFLSIPMLFRLYWFGRVMLLHSRLFTDASSRSIAGLNRVTFNARFILKTLMTLCPGTMLMVFTASLWVLAGWVLRLCERHHTGDTMNIQALKHKNYLNSLWMIAITFLSVGYGDVVPNTYCGRGVAVITGILGTCTSSMVVAVIARKLELSRAEKHVHNFMIDTQLTKQLKHSAANVLRETWLIYKYRRLVDKINPSKIRHHQRKFLMAIYALRKVKRDQRKLAENSVSLGDVAKTTSNSHELIHDIHSTQEGLALRMTAVEHQLSDIQREIGNLADILRAAVNVNPRHFSNNDGDSVSAQRESLRKRRSAIEH